MVATRRSELGASRVTLCAPWTTRRARTWRERNSPVAAAAAAAAAVAVAVAVADDDYAAEARCKDDERSVATWRDAVCASAANAVRALRPVPRGRQRGEQLRGGWRDWLSLSVVLVPIITPELVTP